ncbi:MAG: DUF2298 domain-containing protein [Dehalococcoidia bacterium]
MLGAFALLWWNFYQTALSYRPDGLWTSDLHIWSDWPVHLGQLTSFAFGDNFPPQNPFFSGHALNYHFLSAFTAAAMVKLGMDPVTALDLHSSIFMMLITLGVYAFARRLTCNTHVATLTVILFLLGGGMGWLLTVGDLNESHNALNTFTQHPWDYQAASVNNFRVETTFLEAIAPQRGFLYGLPLALLILTLLLAAVRRNGWVLYLAAGLIAGLLPLAHLGTLLALALITPFLFLLFPSRYWFVFFASWILVAVPQLYFQQGG